MLPFIRRRTEGPLVGRIASNAPMDLSYKPGLVDASSPFGHGPRPDRMHGAALKPIAALGENDIPVALAFAHEEHVALAELVRRPHFGADHAAGRRHLLDNDGGGRIPLEAPFDADVDVVEMESPLATAGTPARPDLDDPPDDDERGSLDELREVLGDGARRRSGCHRRAPRRQNGAQQNR